MEDFQVVDANLMRLVADAIDGMALAARARVTERLLSGEDAVRVELTGEIAAVLLFGETIWTGSPAELTGTFIGGPEPDTGAALPLN